MCVQSLQELRTPRKEFLAMKNPGVVFWVAALTLLGSAQGFSQGNQQGQGKVVVTVLPKQESKPPVSVTAQDISLKVNGKPASVTGWKPLQGAANSLELVLLIDGSARNNLATQFGEIRHFVNGLPPNVTAAIAYMQNGRAGFAGALSADHAKVSSELHLSGGQIASSASPYFCLSDLAKHWPSQDRGARREVVLVTDGIDNLQNGYDPDDPYVQASIADAVRAGVVVYSIYWVNSGAADNSLAANNIGLSLLSEVSQATGGKSYWSGTSNPVSLAPFLGELARRLRNQYELDFTAPLGGKAEVADLKLKLSVPGAEVNAPKQALVSPVAATQK
jgi:hypothetical protein